MRPWAAVQIQASASMQELPLRCVAASPPPPPAACATAVAAAGVGMHGAGGGGGGGEPHALRVWQRRVAGRRPSRAGADADGEGGGGGDDAQVVEAEVAGWEERGGASRRSTCAACARTPARIRARRSGTAARRATLWGGWTQGPEERACGVHAMRQIRFNVPRLRAGAARPPARPQWPLDSPQEPPHTAPAHRSGANLGGAEAARRRRNRGKSAPPRGPGF